MNLSLLGLLTNHELGIPKVWITSEQPHYWGISSIMDDDFSTATQVKYLLQVTLHSVYTLALSQTRRLLVNKVKLSANGNEVHEGASWISEDAVIHFIPSIYEGVWAVSRADLIGIL